VARATLYGGNGEAGSARLRVLSDAADPATRTFEARYVLEGAAADAPLGSTVVVHLPNASRAAALIPISAVFDRGTGPGVWVLPAKAQSVTWRPVTLGAVGEETVTVTGGLQPGERFIALGAHQLHEGESVRTSLTASAQP
jgi:multidrug efflux pump subunit AcrA (membrane-fusion protein)